MAKERIVYRFGRSAFRNFESGNQKEWLLSNGIGGYANSTVHGNSSRIFSSYLIASLHPPVDRVLVLAKTHEELIFGMDGKGHAALGVDAQDKNTREKLFALKDPVPAEVSTEGMGIRRCDLATQQYPGHLREGFRYQTGFTFDFWPEYRYFAEGVRVAKRIALAYGKNETAISYELENLGGQEVVFSITPLFNFRPFGEVSAQTSLDFGVECREGELILTPRAKDGYRIRFAASEGSFFDRRQRRTSMATPDYTVEENELYCVDVSNGFTGVDHHFTPYELHISLAPGEKKEIGLVCELICGQEATSLYALNALARAREIFKEAQVRAEGLLEQAGSRDALTGRLVLSADHFLVRRESTGMMTVLAGYPWFADWGRDTMIAFTGLTLATGRFSQAREVLLSFAKYVSQGMLPNVFPNHADEEPMYNTIDASLWYFYAVYQYLQYTTGLPCYKEAWKNIPGRGRNEGQITPDGNAWKGGKGASTDGKGTQGIGVHCVAGTLTQEEIFVRDSLYPVLCEIFESYRDGRARYGIHMEEDGLIMGGGGLDQLTWMDVRVGDIVVTPRHGKAVEINALWYNAICCLNLLEQRFFGEDTLSDDLGGSGKISGQNMENNGSAKPKQRHKELSDLANLVQGSFLEKFWNGAQDCLYDTIDENGRGDASLRPNQIFAVSLPFTMLPQEKEKSVVRAVYEKLYTPYGLRSLAQGEAGYRGIYAGRLIGRDLAYHMGTTWAYLAGAFFDAWAKTMCQTAKEKEKLATMVGEFAQHMEDGCLGGIAEIFDGDFACDSRGCYTQAWSVAEVLRVWRELCE
ncbi:MAG: amylo-alpha-1,6-glucosidase [Lachnospiraceae bacterium]|nr:amylo-alpha-1,6-glucosidase [Lachnospiraceae bacterium]